MCKSNTFNEHCSKTALFTQMYDILEQLYVFFSRSRKRSAVLRKNLQEVENALQLRNLSKTRWVYRSESIDAMWRSFSAVKDALDSLSSLRSVDKPTRDNASRLCDHVVEFNFMFALMYMHAPNYEDHKKPHHGDAKDRTKHF